MITISLCMIVKNEEKVLARCLDSVADLVDEIIIVDTGSSDRTKEIAGLYTDRIYDFTWTGDFSEARNYSFSLASKDYIYCADADEVLDEINRKRFFRLKEVLLPEVDIVQMKYCNQLAYDSVYNFDAEYRPKLYKRNRPFRFMDPIHEVVVLEPVVYDSDIEILHKPEGSHTGRDITALANIWQNGGQLSKRLHQMYARELYMAGTEEELFLSEAFFKASLYDESRSLDELKEACCILARICRLQGRFEEFLQYALKNIAAQSCTEMCYEIAEYYKDKGDYQEAFLWYYNAAFETECIISLKCKEVYALEGLAFCSEQSGNMEQAQQYRELIKTEK